MRAIQIIALGGVLALCACAGPNVRDGWAVRRAAEGTNEQVQLVHKDGTTPPLIVERKQMVLVARVADKIALASGVGSAVYAVEMSDPKMVNAFATVDKNGIGYIYITLPMFKAVGYDADQWAALLGHETGHLAREHTKANASRATALQTGSAVLGAIPLPLIGALARAVAVPVAATAVNAHYSRDQEREADALSVHYMATAGYDPRGAVRLEQTLLVVAGKSGGGFFDSHPGGEERIRNLEAEIANLSKSPPTADVTKPQGH